MPRKKHVCPNGCGDEFFTAAHVMQEWKVDGFGEFIAVEKSFLQVTHGPHIENIWTCAVCGADAVLVDVEQGGDGRA